MTFKHTFVSTIWPHMFGMNTNLTYLSFYNSSVTFLPKDAFVNRRTRDNNIDKLHTVDFSLCPVREIDEGFFAGIKNITLVQLSSMELEYIPPLLFANLSIETSL
ncbi:uncharacterized protein [Amphiura filiformis]|uniref:uncharacterized protein n=1 Tax=Amphiura filiformis TaxID=82378 RepID=UPI003B2248B5